MEEKSNKIMPVIMGIASVVGVAFSLFHLYTAGVRELPAMQQRLGHLNFGLIPIFLLFSFIYAFLGDRLPGVLGHSGLDTVRIVSHLTLTTEGIFGIPLGASASLVAIFIIFAAFLNGTGTGQYFVNLVMSKFSTTRGGSATAAVLG